jgi:hypothetical protein
MEHTSMIEIHQDVQQAIDYAFHGKFVLNLYDYFKVLDVKRTMVEQFMSSSTVKDICFLITDLDEYIIGGADNEHKQLREGYGHIPKPEARKIKNYLEKILDDMKKYHYDKRPGRRPKRSK